MEPSITLEYTEDGTLQERMDAVKEAGFTAVNLFSGMCKSLMQGSTNDIVELKSQLTSRGITVDWVHAPYAHSVLYDANPEVSSIMIGALKNAVQIAAELNAVSLVVHPLNLNFPDTVEKDSSLEQLLHSFGVLSAYAKKYGVFIAVENIDEPHSTRILPTLFKELPDVTLCFDTGHAHRWDTWDTYLPAYADRISALHIHDNHGETDEHLVPGDGTIDYSSLIQALAGNVQCKYLGIECVQRIGNYSGGCFDLPLEIKARMEAVAENCR